MTARRVLTHPSLWTAAAFVVLPFVAGANPFAGQVGFVRPSDLLHRVQVERPDRR